MKKIGLICSFFMIINLLACQNSMMPSDKQIKMAEVYFSKLRDLLSHDSADLWGVDLYGPTMFVLPDNRMIIANQQDKDSLLIKRGKVFYGFLPEEYNIANTALTFSNELWTCVSRMDFKTDMERNLLLVHESWHRIQNEIGIQAVMSNNIHLEEVDAAILMKLELLALNHVLLSDNINCDNKDLSNALRIRKIRQEKYKSHNENEYECHEGLAEYTALKVLANNAINHKIVNAIILNKIENALKNDTYTHSYAYVTGPAYGFILDEISSDWKNEVMSGVTMNEILLKNVNLDNTDEPSIFLEEITKYYDSEDFINKEYERLNLLKQEEQAMKDKFKDSQLLYIRNNGVNFTYNPNEKVIMFDGLGTIYKSMRLSGDFGTVETNDGIIVTSDWRYFILPYNEDTANNLNLSETYHIKKVDDNKFELVSE